MLKFHILLLLMLFNFYPANAQEQLIVEAKIYKTNSLNESQSLSELLKEVELTHNPSMVSNFGAKSSLQFSFNDSDKNDESLLEILFLSDKNTRTYDIDINLINGETKNISRIMKHPIGEGFIASTTINGASHIIQIDVDEYHTDKAETENKNTQLVTYILEVNSNLGCDNLTIELNSKDSSDSFTLRYTTGAFAAVSVPPGTYLFGNVLCSSSEDIETFELLKGKLKPFNLYANKVNFGGRMILREDRSMKKVIFNIPVNSCTSTYNPQTGSSSTSCSEGMSIGSRNKEVRQIQAYAPTSTAQDIAFVQKVMRLSDDEMVLVPIESKQ